MRTLDDLARFAAEACRGVVVTVVPEPEAESVKAWATDAVRVANEMRNESAMDDVATAFGVGCRTARRNFDGSVSRVFYPKGAAYVVGAVAEQVGLDPVRFVNIMVEEAR